MLSKDPPGSARLPWRRLSSHFVTMVAAMLVGMAVLGMGMRLVLTMLGHADLLDPLEVQVAVMVLSMSAGMTVWMRYHRHRWAGIMEMNAAMLLSFAVLLVPFWAGVLPESAVMTVGHVLMLPAMARVLLHRRAEYGQPPRISRERRPCP
jgi:flagellar biosynthetic protein FliP